LQSICPNFPTARDDGDSTAHDFRFAPHLDLGSASYSSRSPEAYNPWPLSRCLVERRSEAILAARIAFETRPSLDVSKAAKVDALGRAAAGAIPANRLPHGQSLVSDGFMTKVGATDKAIPTLSEKFAIHTLGQEYALSAGPIQVWNVPLNRPSLPWLCCT
jgi:hypothetical protein